MVQVVVDYIYCVICGYELHSGNRSEGSNVCKPCLDGLEI